VAKSQARSSELTRANLWAAIEAFVLKQRAPSNRDDYLEPPDFDHLKALVPSDTPRGLITAMAAFAYFERGDGFRGRWMLTDLRHGAVFIAEGAVVALHGAQNLMGCPFTHTRLNESEAKKITMSILMGDNAK
jgi:hypothetical protein